MTRSDCGDPVRGQLRLLRVRKSRKRLISSDFSYISPSPPSSARTVQGFTANQLVDGPAGGFADDVPRSQVEPADGVDHGPGPAVRQGTQIHEVPELSHVEWGCPDQEARQALDVGRPAGAAPYLASATASSFVTGSILTVDGGFLAKTI